MIVLERRIAWLFRAALKRCFETPSTRADQTPVQIRLGKNGLTMHASTPEITIVYTDPAQTGNGVFNFPLSRFGEFEGRTSDPVEIALKRPNLAVAGWSVKGRTLEREIALSEPESATKLPELPKNFTPLPSSFLSALHDASQCAASEPTKYIINRVQLRGKSGDVVGTDTRQLFVSGGFKFPFTDDVLIPRSGIFGLQPFQTMEQVGVVRTDMQLVIRAGNWMFAFLIEKQGRYPDWPSILPRPAQVETRFRLDAGDAQRFLDSLERRIKGPAAREITVTLDLRDTPCLRYEIDGRVTEVKLPNSEVTGKRLRMCLVLSQFLRILEHRFQEFEIRDALKPIVARDGDRIYLSMPLSPDQALPPRAEPVKESAAPAPVPSREATEPTPSKEMVPVRRPRRSTIIVPTESSVPAPANSFDILDEAEGLRDGLFKVASHAGKILRFLRGVCTQQKLLDFARSSLLALGNQSTTRGQP